MWAGITLSCPVLSRRGWKLCDIVIILFFNFPPRVALGRPHQMNCVQCFQPKTYRTHFPLSLESFQDLLQKLPEHSILGNLSYLGDSYYDMPDHALLTDQPCHGGRWLRFRQVNEDEKNAFWNIRSCHAVEKDNIICHEDIAGEMAILEELYPEPATRPKSLRNVNLELYARIRSARFTFELAKSARLMIECAQLGQKSMLCWGPSLPPPSTPSRIPSKAYQRSHPMLQPFKNGTWLIHRPLTWAFLHPPKPKRVLNT